MTEQDKHQFYKAIYDCFDVHGKDKSDKTVELYFKLLAEYDLETVLKALERVLRSSKFFPRPSEIFEAIEGNESDIIDSAYQEVKALIRNDYHHAIRLKNQITMQVVADMGGLVQFYNQIFSGKDDTGAFFEFKRIYKSYYRRAREGTFIPRVKFLHGYMSSLPGAAPVDPETLPALEIGYQPEKVLKIERPKPLAIGDLPPADPEKTAEIVERLADEMRADK